MSKCETQNHPPEMPRDTTVLRNEIMESQKARIDLLKYKLIAVASLGAVGLGFNTGKDSQIVIDTQYILCIIPLVCIYIDLLCWHNNLRIMVIGKFLFHHADAYETFINDIGKECNRPNKSVYFFELENFALHWSSIILSSLLVLYGMISMIPETFCDCLDIKKGIVFLFFGGIGVILPFIIHHLYRQRVNRLDHIVSKWKKKTQNFRINNTSIASFIKEKYTFSEVHNLFLFLQQKQTFHFPVSGNGLFPASVLSGEALYTGYDHVWVRDNIFVAYSHYVTGETEVAKRTVKTIARFYMNHKKKWIKIIEGKLDIKDPMNRPHIRFSGNSLEEIKQKWPHAQNDALGYFIWLFSMLCNHKQLETTPEEKELLVLFVLYFDKIRYWEDEDSGHWEEKPKVEASSIGAVVGALKEVKLLIPSMGKENLTYKNNTVDGHFVDRLIREGENALSRILPAESVSSDPLKNRKYDAALLFLIYPLNVLSGSMRDQILVNVNNYLTGEYGIRRYVGDSYWCGGYKTKLIREQRSADYSLTIEERNQLLEQGEEAQWCIFDPVISVIYGIQYQNSRRKQDLQKQIYHFNRSLGQLTGEDFTQGGYKCPELYYLENGKYIPNDTVPLLWTQGNLRMAFHYLLSNLSEE